MVVWNGINTTLEIGLDHNFRFIKTSIFLQSVYSVCLTYGPIKSFGVPFSSTRSSFKDVDRHLAIVMSVK